LASGFWLTDALDRDLLRLARRREPCPMTSVSRSSWARHLKRTIRDEDQLSNAKWSIYAGWEVTGWPRTTIRRGEIVYQDGKVIGRPGTGRVIPQAPWKPPALR